nr:immunoglobulin light chain junction region [Macaca mulatta]
RAAWDDSLSGYIF